MWAKIDFGRSQKQLFLPFYGVILKLSKAEFQSTRRLGTIVKKISKKNKKKKNSTHCRAIKVVFLFVGKNGFWWIKKQIVFSFYGVFLKLSKVEFQSTRRIDRFA